MRVVSATTNEATGPSFTTGQYALFVDEAQMHRVDAAQQVCGELDATLRVTPLSRSIGATASSVDRLSNMLVPSDRTM
jgi:hypothetical protein